MTTTHQQPGLPFDTTAAREIRMARARDPETSKHAAREALGLASEHAGKILDTLRAATEPMDANDIAIACGLTYVQVSRRLHELHSPPAFVADPSIEVVDRCGRSPSGRPAQRWRACS